jgi:hypothetical protein
MKTQLHSCFNKVQSSLLLKGPWQYRHYLFLVEPHNGYFLFSVPHIPADPPTDPCFPRSTPFCMQMLGNYNQSQY